VLYCIAVFITEVDGTIYPIVGIRCNPREAGTSARVTTLCAIAEESVVATTLAADTDPEAVATVVAAAEIAIVADGAFRQVRRFAIASGRVADLSGAARGSRTANHGCRFDFALAGNANHGSVAAIAIVGAVSVHHALTGGHRIGLTAEAGPSLTLVTDSTKLTIVAEVGIECVDAAQLWIARICCTIVEVLAGAVLWHVVNRIGGLFADIVGTDNVVAQLRRSTILTACHSATSFSAVAEEIVVTKRVVVDVDHQLTLFDALIDGTIDVVIEARNRL